MSGDDTACGPRLKGLHVAPPCGETCATSFPFDELYRRVDGEDLAEVAVESTKLSENERAAVIRFVKGFFQFVAGGLIEKPNGVIHETGVNAGHSLIVERRVARRALALVWLIDHTNFTCHPISLTRFAKELRIPIQKLSAEVTRARDAFGIENVFLSHSRHRRKPKPPDSKNETTAQN